MPFNETIDEKDSEDRSGKSSKELNANFDISRFSNKYHQQNESFAQEVSKAEVVLNELPSSSSNVFLWGTLFGVCLAIQYIGIKVSQVNTKVSWKYLIFFRSLFLYIGSYI